MRVVEVGAEATHGLRRRVLRDDRADAEVRYPEDDHPLAFHLAAVDDDGLLVAVSTWAPVPTERRPGAPSWRLRGMAVAPEVQGRGAGSLLLARAIERLREAGAEVLWAEGRDTALGFYQRHGWVVEGEGYLRGPQIPHHTVVLELGRAPQRP